LGLIAYSLIFDNTANAIFADAMMKRFDKYFFETQLNLK